MSIKPSKAGNHVYFKILIFLYSKKNELQAVSLYIPEILKFCFEEVSIIFEFSSLSLSLSPAQTENGTK